MTATTPDVWIPAPNLSHRLAGALQAVPWFRDTHYAEKFDTPDDVPDYTTARKIEIYEHLRETDGDVIECLISGASALVTHRAVRIAAALFEKDPVQVESFAAAWAAGVKMGNAVIINSFTARALAALRSPAVTSFSEYFLRNPNEKYQLPQTVDGVCVNVENNIKLLEKDGSPLRGYVWPSNVMAVIRRGKGRHPKQGTSSIETRFTERMGVSLNADRSEALLTDRYSLDIDFGAITLFKWPEKTDI